MKRFCAPEIANVSVLKGSVIPIYSDSSVATPASTAYVIGKILKEILDMAKDVSKDNDTSSNYIVINSLFTNDIMDTINAMCTDTPEKRYPVGFLSKIVMNFMNKMI